MGGGLEVLGPGGVPADRAAEPQGEPGDQDLLGVEVRLGAEAAADLGGDGPDAFLGDSQDARHARLHPMRGLGGGPHRDPVAVHPGGDRPRFHGAWDQALDPEVERHLDLTLRGLGRALGMEFPDEGSVPCHLGIEELRALGARRPGVAGSGEVPVVHEDQRGGVGRLFGRLGDHRHHRIADREDLAVGERPPRRQVEFGERAGVRRPGHGEGLFQRRQDVRRGEDPDDARRGGGFLAIDLDDLGVRIGTADDREMEGAGKRDVRGVMRLTGDEPRVFPPSHPIADGLGSDCQAVTASEGERF